MKSWTQTVQIVANETKGLSRNGSTSALDGRYVPIISVILFLLTIASPSFPTFALGVCQGADSAYDAALQQVVQAE